MSDFKAKMHQIRFPLGLCPRPAGGAYSTPPDPIAVFKGAYTSKGREGKRGGRGTEGGGERKGRGGKGKREEGERKGRGGRVRRAPFSCWHRAPRRVNPALDSALQG